jgi:hypothetical protein
MLNIESKDFSVANHNESAKLQQPSVEDVIMFYSLMLNKLKLDKSKWLKIDLRNQSQH